MSKKKIYPFGEEDQKSLFLKALLDDMQSLEYMLDNNWFETDTIRIGAEQEMVVVDKDYRKPSTVAVDVINSLSDNKWIDTEFAKFNIETNIDPKVFTKSAFSEMEKEITSYLNIIQKELDKKNAQIVLTGILPTIRKFDLELTNVTPKQRYKALIDAINSQLLGKSYELKVLGVDELIVKHNSPLIEACNTSFQVHYQTTPESFAKMYNISQVLAAPVMAIAANSPLVFGKRLWHETRIAMFQQGIDTRASHDHLRERSPRVRFGNDWIDKSILEIYKDDIARFRVLLSAKISENSLDKICNNEVPKLMALNIHNSTVYRWNRACYGISDTGKPHIRIENRVLPAGPTVLDEIANAAFWIGAMEGLSLEYDDVRKYISFIDVRDNFGKAAKFGIDSKLTWFNEKKITPTRLVLDELLPLAKKGLESRNIDGEDIERYLSVIEERAKAETNGAHWQLKAYSKLREKATEDQALSTVTATMISNQEKNLPISKWELPKFKELKKYRPSNLLVSEFMQTDLLTVEEDDILEFVADLMEWKNTSFALVEDEKGKLVGLISNKDILKVLIRKRTLEKQQKQLKVRDIMNTKPLTLSQNDSILEAAKIVLDTNVNCIPVVEKEELVGVITKLDLIKVTSTLLEQLD